MSELKKIYVAEGPGDAHLFHGLLAAEGIDAVVRGDDVVPLQGGGLFEMETRPSVWVLATDPERYARAVALADDYAARRGPRPEPAGGAWRCRACGEAIEPQFTDCWCCGAARG